MLKVEAANTIFNENSKPISRLEYKIDTQYERSGLYGR